ncbi:MAG TPA: DUF6515 family protein [Candidatus Acidoferrales bacterium]|nr:DUF6515 family protein [Candidatus Acidoferrales bacterium]
MKTTQAYPRKIVVLSAMILLVSIFVASDASAQRRRVYTGRGGGTAVTVLPRAHYPVFVGGRRYFYGDGFFYRGGRRGYVMIPAPIGARIRVLPFGFINFSIGAIPYYYYGGVYYQYIPGQNVYEVVPKPVGTPSNAPADSLDIAILANGTSLLGIFEGADADTIRFQVNGEVRRIPITQITSINFAPSLFDTTGHK